MDVDVDDVVGVVGVVVVIVIGDYQLKAINTEHS